MRITSGLPHFGHWRVISSPVRHGLARVPKPTGWSPICILRQGARRTVLSQDGIALLDRQQLSQMRRVLLDRSRYKSSRHGFHVSLCRWLVHLTFGAVAGVDFWHLGFLRLGHGKNPLLIRFARLVPVAMPAVRQFYFVVTMATCCEPKLYG